MVYFNNTGQTLAEHWQVETEIGILLCGKVHDCDSLRARGVLFVLKGPYDPRVPPIVKFSQEYESARLTKIILSKSTVKTL